MHGLNSENNRQHCGLVYSTSCGRTCPGCGQALASCSCVQDKRQAVPETDGIARLRYDLSGRKGKGMTLISGLLLNQGELTELAAKLKRKFGVGGAVKDYVIALQGDLREQAKTELLRLGFRVK